MLLNICVFLLIGVNEYDVKTWTFKYSFSSLFSLVLSAPQSHSSNLGWSTTLHINFMWPLNLIYGITWSPHTQFLTLWSNVICRIECLARDILEDIGHHYMIVLCVLKGGYKFCSDLVESIKAQSRSANRRLTTRVEFIRFKSYLVRRSRKHNS